MRATKLFVAFWKSHLKDEAEERKVLLPKTCFELNLLYFLTARKGCECVLAESHPEHHRALMSNRETRTTSTSNVCFRFLRQTCFNCSAMNMERVHVTWLLSAVEREKDFFWVSWTTNFILCSFVFHPSPSHPPDEDTFHFIHKHWKAQMLLTVSVEQMLENFPAHESLSRNFLNEISRRALGKTGEKCLPCGPAHFAATRVMCAEESSEKWVFPDAGWILNYNRWNTMSVCERQKRKFREFIAWSVECIENWEIPVCASLAGNSFKEFSSLIHYNFASAQSIPQKPLIKLEMFIRNFAHIFAQHDRVIFDRFR